MYIFSRPNQFEINGKDVKNQFGIDKVHKFIEKNKVQVQNEKKTFETFSLLNKCTLIH